MLSGRTGEGILPIAGKAVPFVLTMLLVVLMLAEIEAGGEAKAAEYARRLDKWEGEIVVSAAQRAGAAAQVSEKLKADIRFAHDKVRRFAEAQRNAIQNTEIELFPGLVAGHRNIPVPIAGCYVPGGRYAHIASAVMSVTTAKVAGVDNVMESAHGPAERGPFAIIRKISGWKGTRGGAHSHMRRGLFAQIPC